MSRISAVPVSGPQALGLWQRADEAGRLAADSAKIQPMVVQERASPFDDGSPVVQEWVAPDGPCGFAKVVIKPSRGGIASWMKANKLGRYSEYERAWVFNISAYGQSMGRKSAYASAFAKVLSDAGIYAYAESRMD